MEFSTDGCHESLFGEAVPNCCGDVGVEFGRCHGVLVIKVVCSLRVLCGLGVVMSALQTGVVSGKCRKIEVLDFLRFHVGP